MTKDLIDCNCSDDYAYLVTQKVAFEKINMKLIAKLFQLKRLFLRLLWLMELMKLINIRGLLCHNEVHWLKNNKLLK